MVTLRIQALARPDTGGTLLLPETACIRLVALLPSQWRPTPLIGGGQFTLDVLIPTEDGKSAHQIIERAFMDPGLRAWTWAAQPEPSVTCSP
ncbi:MULTISPECIES: hypothetical protein [unclassified Streptomyces]|uniref:hypothetical protein n=1 Tax=unclassified Streptomyces TaxID=2593676 RepID=UPI002E30B3B3|nr:hypothetical protein [Streptomyces sp. NBC_01278]